MARHDPLQPDAPTGGFRGYASDESLIGPNLLRAFPLPVTSHDERFRLLLEALARSRGGTG